MAAVRQPRSHAPAESSVESWEAVLAAVEADVARTAAAFALPLPSSPQPLAPAETMLPLAEPPVLPPLAQMPDVPPELVERITELRSRIDELRGELERCLDEARRESHALVARGTVAALAPEPPHFVDRRF
jgi:hypothetical protein